MIYEGSRYEDHAVAIIATTPTVLRAPAQEWTFGYANYTSVDGDRLDALAGRFYSDANKWWMIARANPTLFYPGEIPSGTVIRIPEARDVR